MSKPVTNPADKQPKKQKGGKRPHKYARDKSTRYWLTAERKDRKVKKSSHGMFHSVNDLLTMNRRRPTTKTLHSDGHVDRT